MYLNIIFDCISSGPEMLVAFHSSPFSAPLQSNIPNRGFELDVDVLFADSDSYDYARPANKGGCEFHINASNPGECFVLTSSMKVTLHIAVSFYVILSKYIFSTTILTLFPLNYAFFLSS